jgi:hypothetical protein
MRSLQGLQRPDSLTSQLTVPRSVSCHTCRVAARPSSNRSSSSRLVVVAANAPASGDTTPVTREDLINHLKSGCKSRDKW